MADGFTEIQPGDLGPMARRAREIRGLTVREAAEELEVTSSALSQAERGAQRMVQLAMRALNFHLERASEAGSITPGGVRQPLLAEGSAVEVLGQVRSPDAERRAALLRRSLLTRGIDVSVRGRTAVVDFADVRVRIDLEFMFVDIGRRGFALGRPGEHGSGAQGLIAPGPATAGEEDQRRWSGPIDRFSEALAKAAEGPHFDERVLGGALQSFTSGRSKLS